MTRLTLTTAVIRGAAPADAGACAACDLRCACGSLVAKVVDGFVELKCRRCKRTLRIPVQRDP